MRRAFGRRNTKAPGTFFQGHNFVIQDGGLIAISFRPRLESIRLRPNDHGRSTNEQQP